MSVEETELTEGEKELCPIMLQNERKEDKIKSNPGQTIKITKSWFDSYLCKYMTQLGDSVSSFLPEPESLAKRWVCDAN